MKSDIKKLAGSRIELLVEVPTEEFKPFVDEALREFVQEAELPGFRKGKAPADLVKERTGEYALYEHAARDAAKKYFTQLANENNWEPLDQPDIEVVKLAPKNEFAFKAAFTVFPDVALPEYKELLKPFKTQYREPNVADAQVQETLEWLQKSRRTYRDATHAIEKGNRVTVDFTMTEKGVALPDGAQNDFSFVVGENRIFPEFEKQIMGLAKDARKIFQATLPEDYWNRQIAGKDIDFSVTIKNVQDVVLPMLDDVFAKTLGKFENLDALRLSIRDGMEQEEKEKEQQRFRMALLDAIDTKTTIDVPESLVVREQDMMVHELKHSIEQTGMEWTGYCSHIGKTEEQMKTEFRDQATKRVRYALILRAVAEKESIEPSKEELEEEMSRALLQYKTPEQAAQSIDVESLASYTKSILANEKVSQFLESCARA